MMQKTIKSYVLRAGRVSKRQQMGLEVLSRYEMPDISIPWDFNAIFQRLAPTVVEIGFGMGASLVKMAIAQPDTNFIGIEVHRPGIGALVAEIEAQSITNIKIIAQDATEVFKQAIPDHSLAGVQIFFPDPWPKKRHHKRRLVQPEFVSLLTQKLEVGGFIHFATDWEEYAHYALDVFSSAAQLCNQGKPGEFSPRPDSRPVTKFEKRGQKLGHGVWDLIFIKI